MPAIAQAAATKRVAAFGLVAAVGLAACTGPPFVGGCGGMPLGGAPACTHGPTGAPGGLSQEAAIAAARRVAPSATGTTKVVWAAIEHDPYAPADSLGGPWVWEVRMEAAFAASPCPSGFLDQVPTASDPACLDAESGLVAVLDYDSGALLGWMH